MARKTSKQRRQAQNRAIREARAARSRAANTPVTERRVTAEEPTPKERRSRRRRRSRKSAEQVSAEARTIVEASGQEDVDDLDDEAAAEDTDEVEPAMVAPVRRRSSAVFSPEHRAAVGAATADRAPARTHAGVLAATGVDELVAGTASAGAATPARAARSSSSGSSAPSRRTGASERTGTSGRNGAARGPADRKAPTPSDPTAYRPRPTSSARPLPAFLDRFGGNEPGGRWVMLSFVTILVASVVVNFVDIVPEIVTDASGEQVQTGNYLSIWHYGIGPGLVFLLPPILVMAIFIFTARPWDRRRSWNYALALLAFSTFITQSISIYIIPIGLLAWGCWQARKAALAEVGGDPRVLREVERERRIQAREALRARRAATRES